MDTTSERYMVLHKQKVKLMKDFREEQLRVKEKIDQINTEQTDLLEVKSDKPLTMAEVIKYLEEHSTKAIAI